MANTAVSGSDQKLFQWLGEGRLLVSIIFLGTVSYIVLKIENCKLILILYNIYVTKNNRSCGRVEELWPSC